jgi:hypothetical protein
MIMRLTTRLGKKIHMEPGIRGRPAEGAGQRLSPMRRR